VRSALFTAPALYPLLASFCFVFAPLSSRSAVVQIPAAADTRLSSLDPSSNFGSGVDFIVGSQGNNALGALNRSLLRFDLSGSIPAGSIIRDARLTVTVVKDPFAAQGSNFELHRMLVPWDEMQATWTISQTDVIWAAPGGLADTDFLGPATSSAPSGIGLNNISFSNLASDIQFWLDHPATNNFGWMMLSDSEEVHFTARRIGSREGFAPPSLEVTFDAAFRIGSVSLSADLITLTFDAPANFTYIVQWTDALDNPDWQELERFDPSDTDQTLEALDSSGNGPQRFYRVLQTTSPP